MQAKCVVCGWPVEAGGAKVGGASEPPLCSEPCAEQWRAGGGDGGDEAADREAIRAHVVGLWEAFLRRDREAIRAGHTEDWRGFQIRSRRLVNGIDAYMRNAEEVLERFQGERYEFVDFEIELHGEMALVYYLAREVVSEEGGPETTLLIRALDVYRREAAGWNQCGSNICALPEQAG